MIAQGMGGVGSLGWVDSKDFESGWVIRMAEIGETAKPSSRTWAVLVLSVIHRKARYAICAACHGDAGIKKPGQRGDRANASCLLPWPPAILP